MSRTESKNMTSHKEIEDHAAAWLAKRDGGNWSSEDQAQLAHWLENSIAHRVAFLRLEDVWDETRRLRALSAGRMPGIVPPPGKWRTPPFFDSNRQPPGATGVDTPRELVAFLELKRRIDDVSSDQAIVDTDNGSFNGLAAQGTENSSSAVDQFEPTIPQHEESMSLDAFRPGGENLRDTLRTPQEDGTRRIASSRGVWAIAASVLFALGIGSYIVFSPAADRYSTPIGGIAFVPLRDGSNITLNTASKIRVDLTPQERLIDLQQGEAFFKVAKDPTRPFVVRVGNKRIVAVGTQFSVRRDSDDIRVVVIEGTVRLESANSELSGSNGSGPKFESSSGDGAGVTPSDGSAGAVMPESTRLPAGTIARASNEDVLVERGSILQAEDLLSWRQGYLRFHDTTLAEAIAEFNRYNTHSIAIDDPTIAAIRISGTFRPTNYQAFMRLLGDGYSIRAEDKGDRIVLTKH